MANVDCVGRAAPGNSLLLRASASLVCNFPRRVAYGVTTETSGPRSPRLRRGPANVAASRGKPRTRHSSADHLRWRSQPLGHGSPPSRRDTEKHGKAQDLFGINAADPLSNKFQWPSVSREAGFCVGWRRCDASLRRSRGRMRTCTQIRQRPAERGCNPRRQPLPWLAARPIAQVIRIASLAATRAGTALLSERFHSHG